MTYDQVKGTCSDCNKGFKLKGLVCEGSLEPMVIAGIVIGVLVVVGGAVGLGIFLFMKSKKTNKTFKVSKVDGIVAAKAAD